MKNSVEYIKKVAKQLRLDVMEMVYEAKDGHPGPAFSIADIVSTLYFEIMNVDSKNPKLKNRDRLILSKGHACPIVYAALARKGFFDISNLSTLRKYKSMLQGHPDMKSTPGIDATTGSLGNGVSIGLGMASASLYTNTPYYVYVIVGDGEQQEGMIWEAAMAASKFNAGNLIVFADCNHFQSGGDVESISTLYPLIPKWESFGWHCQEIDGHSIEEIVTAVEKAKSNKTKPSLIACKTTKGKGLPFMENDNSWHKRVPTIQELEIARELLKGENL